MSLVNITAQEENSTLSCHLQYDTIDFKVQAALRSAIGLFSFACCGMVVFIIVLFKKYKFYTQRLILYLSIAAMIHAFSYTLTRINYSTPRPIEDRYCYFGGLINHYTAANEVLSVCCVTLSLVVRALCNRNTAKAEPVFVVVIFLLPASWFWVPIWLKGYGTIGGWCSIRILNTNCSPYRYEPWLQLGLRYIPLYTLMFVILVSIILVATRTAMEHMRRSSKWDPAAGVSMKENLKKEIQPLIWYPIIFLLLNIFLLINQIHEAIHSEVPPSVLIYLRILTSPLRGAFIAIAFALDSETRSRLRPAQCKAACLDWVGRETVEDFSLANSNFVESYFSVPYREANSL